MKKTKIIFTLLLFCIQVSIAQEFENANLTGLINSELAFCKLAQKKSTRDAFLYYTNDSSLGFNDEIDYLQERWKKRKADTSRLWWEPGFVDISSSGDFGISTGPWEYKAGHNSPVIAQGYYFTVWVKQPDKKWKVGIDMGISYTAPIEQNPIVTSQIPLKDCNSKSNDKSEITLLENKFLNSFKTIGIEAYEQFLSAEAIFLYSGYQPINNKPDILKFLAERNNQIQFKLKKVMISQSDDMAAFLGTSTVINDQKSLKAGWLHVWKKENCKTWKLIVEVISF